MAIEKPILLDRIIEPDTTLPKVEVQFHHNIDYQEAWDLQRTLHKELVDRKLANRQALKEGRPTLPQKHYLLMVTHPPVYTLGKSGSQDHLLLNEQQLEEQGFTYYKINRGGDITYHGPGQQVVYPIFDLDEIFTDVHRYVRCLEEVIIRTLANNGLTNAYREKGYTGVWFPADTKRPKRKICAIGVHLSRWVTMHGLAFNVSVDLNHFKNIIPCGIAEQDRTVTSMDQEVRASVELRDVSSQVLMNFKEVFGLELIL
jgi:lipoyl(octanoyl) transferase